MKRFIHAIALTGLSLVMLIRMMAMPIALLDYSFNHRYIASRLCENRLNTAISCGGTCYLKKQLTKSNESQESGNQKENNKRTGVDFIESILRPSFFCFIPIAAYSRPSGELQIPDPFTGNIFHPPIA